jgi:hypothetical protein
MGIKVTDNQDANGLKINTDHEALVALTSDVTKSGFAAFAGEHDSGSITGTRDILQADISHDFRLRTGMDNLTWNEFFSGTVINTTKFATPLSNATVVQAGGFITLNSGGSTTSGHGCILKTWRTFPIFGTFGTYFEYLAKFNTVTFDNNISELGAALTAGTVATAPADGAFFRHTSAGLECVLVNNAAEIVSVPVSSVALEAAGISLTNTNHYIAFNAEDVVEYWVNDLLVGKIPRPTTGQALTASMQLCAYARVYNSSTNTGTAQKLSIAMINVSFADMESAMLWENKAAMMHDSCGLIPSNGTATGQTQTTGITNTALPVVMTTISATALGTNGVVGLGGIQRHAQGTGASLTADSAWMLFSYLVPAPVTAAPVSASKGLLITGLDFTLTSRVVVGTNAGVIPVIVELNYGCTNSNPTTTENITTQTTPVKGVRRLQIGTMQIPINMPIGTLLTPIQWKPRVGVYCEAGTYIQITIRPLVTWALANTQELVAVANFDGLWI